MRKRRYRHTRQHFLCHCTKTRAINVMRIFSEKAQGLVNVDSHQFRAPNSTLGTKMARHASGITLVPTPSANRPICATRAPARLQTVSPRRGMTMLNTATLDELAKKIGEAIAASPARDVERNIKALLQSSLQRFNLVPREEFELQAQVLRRTREKLEALETRVAQLEGRPRSGDR